ncbi:MAG TPA: methyltransferase domain-containing protein [Candidatus Aquilonibacter sp.]|nr:methyltransferase domain-containing protein [Candidatus Aquilonibacter sp.]
MPIWRKRTERNKLYEQDARRYERHAETSIYNSRYERPAMLARIGDVSGLRILDAGSAAGFYAAALSPHAKSIVAVDASEAMIDLVAQKQLPNVAARVHDLAEPIPRLEDASVDLVVSSLTLHYLPSWETVMREFARVLVPGGRIVVSTHHPAMTYALIDNYFATQRVTDTWAIKGGDTEVTFYHRSLESIVSPFVEAGFRITRIVEPHLELRADATEAERRLATRPWFLIVDAVTARSHSST